MTYSTDFRQLALAKLAQGLSIRQVAKELGIGSDTVFKWKKNPIPKGCPKDRKPLKITKEALLRDVGQYPMPIATNGHNGSTVRPTASTGH
ncbi:helix-turn-helix domain-containing protein [Neisseria yangbaofengii]|uniref:helix-turn-helix domain-containing protein n=1 Tax=Neisseria yangbaofengii TaxID=2709396 RepID=UPI003B9E4AED